MLNVLSSLQHNMVRSARLHDYDYNRLSNKQAGLFVGRDQFPDELEDFINSPVSTSARMWYFSSLSTLPWSLLDLAAFAKAHSARAGIGHACDCLFGWGVLWLVRFPISSSFVRDADVTVRTVV